MTNFLKSGKVLAILLIGLFCFTNGYAGPGAPFSKLVFFGDSLTDDGNLYAAFLGFLPKSPPYYQGRFSNGEVWADILAKSYRQQYNMHTTNYAYGGETTIWHNPVDGYLPYTLDVSKKDYWVRTLGQDRSRTLFLIWMGANDYLNGTDDVQGLTSAVTDKIKDVIASLISYGGKNFLVLNLPDISLTPFGRADKGKDTFHQIALAHNKKLQARMNELSNAYKAVNIQVYDINALFVSIIDGSNNKYPKVNTTEACWQGGYTLHPPRQEEIARFLQEQWRLNPRENKMRLSPDAMADYILKAPALLEAYYVAKSVDTEPNAMCQNPDQYFFWDHVHPTRIVHQYFADILREYINQHFQPTQG